MNIQSEIRKGSYFDSVVLMQLQRALLQLPGVLDAGVVMATAANCTLLQQSGLLTESAGGAAADDTLIVVKAESENAARLALAQVDSLLNRKRAAVDAEFRPRSLEAAARLLPAAGWVLISVPGRFAADVARAALKLRKHVFLYSDNVALEDEIELKQTARAQGLLLLGPDCGTAIVNGIGLGFANRVRRGAVGIVGASGTGLQTVASRVHQLGAGVSHALGTGGRDLHASVGAITAHQTLDLLARDPATQVIVLISKPPAPEVAARLLSAAQACGKPVVVDFIGYPAPARQLGNLHFATSLNEAAELAVSRLAGSSQPALPPGRALTGKWLRGLFSGGTLAYEAMLVLQTTLHPLFSNAPVHKSQQLADALHSRAHTLLDMGGDEFTVGRLHPLLDNDLRLRRIKQEAADPQVGMILLDVVLGEGVHPDPAAELAPVIAASRRSGLEFVVILIGTDEDPQDMQSQQARLEAAGCRLFTNPSAALAYVCSRFGAATAPAAVPVELTALTQPMAALNAGVESFYNSMVAQGAQCLQLDWRPPAAGNAKLADVLAKMNKR
ncbi:MAG: acyl-CoA synthetase FdrA [Chloroflexi bacterium]|nr:acyl-CoA synthetase FdrA [Chloroflexota bacterium]